MGLRALALVPLGGVFLLAGPLSFFWLLDPLMLSQPTDAHLHLPPPQALAALPALTLAANAGQSCSTNNDCNLLGFGLALCGDGICCQDLCTGLICGSIKVVNGQTILQHKTCAAGTGVCSCAWDTPAPNPITPGKGGGAMSTAVSGAVVVAALAAAALAAAQ